MELIKHDKCKLTKCEVTIDPEGKKYPRMHLQYLVETEYETKLIDIPEAILPLKADTLEKYCYWDDWKNKISIINEDYYLLLDYDKCRLECGIGEFSDKEPYMYAEKIIERRAKKSSAIQ